MARHFAGAARRVKAEQRRLGWAAYQTAVLARTARLPTFADFMGDKPQGRPDTMSALRKLAARLPKERA